MKTGAQGFDSLGEMLRATQADLVAIATPSGLHPEQTVEIAASGHHVMTEKPMATRWQDGKRMVQTYDAAGVHLFVVKQNRHNATLQLLKRAMLKKRFGRIHMVTINVFWSRPQSYYDSAPRRGTWEFDGGAFMNQASHYVDLLDWLIGPVESVHAYTATLARNIEVEDSWRGAGEMALRRDRQHQRHHAHLPQEPGPSSARKALPASAASRSTTSSIGNSRNPTQTTTSSRTPATRPLRSTATAIPAITTTSSRCCAARRNPIPTAAKTCAPSKC